MFTDINSFVNKEKLKDYISSCIQCMACVEKCCTSYTTDNEKLSPVGRLNIIDEFFKSGEIVNEDLEPIYLCTECGRCETICPSEIPISEVIADSKVLLVHAGKGPLKKHLSMIESIKEKRNAVNGLNDQRLDWIPEEYKGKVQFEDGESTTLLYMGCLSSFLAKKTAAASLDILMTADVNFKILKDEFCCGIYPYNAGKIDEAGKIFTEMHNKFKQAGIKEIIVPCAGCHRTFSKYYPRLLTDFNIKVLHISELIPTLINENKLKLIPKNKEIAFHDACKSGRKAGLYDQPRNILKKCGFTIEELNENREDSVCCGSGSGVRSIDRSLSADIANKAISGAKSDIIASTCPFCIFNFNYTSHKKELNKKAEHISVIVQSCLQKNN